MALVRLDTVAPGAKLRLKGGRIAWVRTDRPAGPSCEIRRHDPGGAKQHERQFVEGSQLVELL